MQSLRNLSSVTYIVHTKAKIKYILTGWSADGILDIDIMVGDDQESYTGWPTANVLAGDVSR